MSPKILEYEDKRVKVTAQAYAIPEIKAILDKYDLNAEPYLHYIHGMTAPDSPYINIPEEDRSEGIIYDIQHTYGDFQYEDPIVRDAIDRMKSMYTSSMMLLALELSEEIHRLRKYLRDTPLCEENLPMRQSVLKDIDKYATTFLKVKDQAEKELKANTKGDHEIGDY